MNHLPTAAKANVSGAPFGQGLPSLRGTDKVPSSKTTKVNSTLKALGTKANAKANVDSTVQASRGFTVKRASREMLITAKGWMVAYLTGAAKGKFPSVAFNPSAKDRPQNFACMLAVGFGPGWTNDADGSAKVDLIQQAYGIQVAGRKLGFPAMASTSATVREKTMRSLAADWIGRADAKGTFRLVATKPTERVAVRAIRGAADKPTKAKGAAKAAPRATQRNPERANGKVITSVDPKLRAAARRAERKAAKVAERAANPNVQAAKDAALADMQADA